MPTPSFDEILSRARTIADQNAQGPSTGERAAKGISQFVSSILNASTGEKKTVGGYLSPQGKLNTSDPYTTGGTLLETLARHAFGGGGPKTPAPEGSIPLSPEQTGDFTMKSALQGQKYDALTNIANIRAKAMAKAAGGRISTTTHPMVKEASDYVWALIGKDPETELNLPILTYGDADRMLRAKGIDTNTELKSIGYDISLNKDPLFGVQPADRARIQGTLQNAGKPKASAPAPAVTGSIRVRLKSTGATGTVPANEFDASLYDKIK